MISFFFNFIRPNSGFPLPAVFFIKYVNFLIDIDLPKPTLNISPSKLFFFNKRKIALTTSSIKQKSLI